MKKIRRINKIREKYLIKKTLLELMQVGDLIRYIHQYDDLGSGKKDYVEYHEFIISIHKNYIITKYGRGIAKIPKSQILANNKGYLWYNSSCKYKYKIIIPSTNELSKSWNNLTRR